MQETNKNKYDARELLNLSHSGKFHDTEFSLEQYKLDEVLDVYFKLFNSRYDSEELNSESFKKNKSDLYKYISSLDGVNDKNLSSAQIYRSWILKIKLKDWKEHTINLIDKWNYFGSDPEKQTVINKAREKEKDLQEKISQEEFLGWAVTYEYSEYIWAGVSTFVWYGTYRILDYNAKNAKNLVSLKSIIIKTEQWLQKIKLEEPYIWTKEQLRGSLLNILKKFWYEYDPVNKKIFSPTKVLLEKTSNRLKTITYEEAKKEWIIKEEVTKEKFEELRNKAIRKSEPIMQKLKSWELYPKKWVNLLKKALPLSIWEAFFWPVFFVEAKKDETPMSIIKSIGGMAAFSIWVKIGSKLGPGAWKLLTAPIAGWAAAFGAELMMDKVLEATRKKWQYFDEANYKDWKSGTIHVVSWLFIWEISDILQSAWQKGREIVWLERTQWWDIWIPQMNINLPFIGNVWQTPEITLYQHKVNLWTNPREWLRDSMGRDIYDWNNQVDLYKIELTGEIYEILWDYYRNQWVFSNELKIEKVGWKDKLLEEQLKKVMMKDWVSENFTMAINSITSAVLNEVPNLSEKKIPNSAINQTISLYIDSMKIDTVYVDNQIEELIIRRNEIRKTIQSLPINQEQKDFLDSIPEKMIEVKPPYDNEKEEKMYQDLLASKKEYENMELWLYIAQLLDIMSEYKEDQYFFSQIQKRNFKWYEWRL